MIPRTHPFRQTSPRQHRTEAPRLNARLLAITGPTHQQAVGVLLLGEPDHATQNLLGQYQQDAEERGLGFAAVVCPDTEGGRQQSLVPMLRDHLSNQALFIILDPRRDGAASAAEDEALGLANLLKANGFEINMASAALVNVHDPMADMAVSDIQLMAHTYRLLQEDDNPEARMVLNLLDDPSEGSMDCRFTLMGAALHYQSHGMEPLLPMWYRIGMEASPAESEDSDADADAGTIASALSGWIDLDDAARRSTIWQAIEQRDIRRHRPGHLQRRHFQLQRPGHAGPEPAGLRTQGAGRRQGQTRSPVAHRDRGGSAGVSPKPAGPDGPGEGSAAPAGSGRAR